LIKSWNVIYDGGYLNNTGYELERDVKLTVVTRTLLNNAAGKKIAFELEWRIIEDFPARTYVDNLIVSQTPIVFLPKTEDTKAGIDVLIDVLLGPEEEPAPSWIKNYQLPGEIEKISEIQSLVSTKEEIEGKIDNNYKGLNKLNEFKKLLYSSGDELEAIVERSLAFLDIIIETTAKEGKEDRIFKDDDSEIPVEIRGTDRRGFNEKDLNQLISRLVDKPVSTTYRTRGVFIFNHSRLIEPNERQQPFHVNIVEKASTWNICLVTSQTLFQLVERKMKSEVLPNLKGRLFNTIGIFDLDDIENADNDNIK